MSRPQNDKNKLVKAILSTVQQHLRSYEENLFKFYDSQHKCFTENYDKNDKMKQDLLEIIEVNQGVTEELNEKSMLLNQSLEIDQDKLVKVENVLKVELKNETNMEEFWELQNRLSKEIENQIKVLNKYKENTGMEITVQTEGFKVNFKYIDSLNPSSEFWAEFCVFQGKLAVSKLSHRLENSQKLCKALEDSQNLLVFLKSLRNQFKSLNRQVL